MQNRFSFSFSLLFIVLALVLLLTPLSCSNAESKTATNTTGTKTPSTSQTAVTASTSKTASTSAAATNTVSATTAPVSNITLDIELPPVLETLETLMFKVVPNVPISQIPVNTQWQWDFGDGTALDTKVGLTEPFLTGGHRYTKNGDYKVTVNLIDLATKKPLATASKGFIVSDIAALKKTNHIRLTLALSGMAERKDVTEFEASMKTFDAEIYAKDPWTFEWYGEWRMGSAGDWRGDEIKFTGSYHMVADTETGEQTTDYTMSGKILVNTDGIQLVDFNFSKEFENPKYKGTEWTWRFEYQLELMPLPVTKISGGESPKFLYNLKGYEKLYPLTKYAFYGETFPTGKIMEWFPQEIDDLTSSDLQVTLDTLVLHRP
jgi:hypothetical protein